MDAKKKRNKKKKGNQGKNAGDLTSNAGEAAPQYHNDKPPSTDHHKSSDVDDAMSSVGERASQYHNEEPTPETDHNGTNAHDAASSVGEGMPCYQNHDPALTQENHKVSDAVHADQRSIGFSESSVELDTNRRYDAKVDKLQETIKHLDDGRSLWLQKVSILESELEKLHNKVGYHEQNEFLLEEKLSTLQNGYDLLVKKEGVLDNKVRYLEDNNDTLIHQMVSLKERLSGLEESNQTLQLQVLEETSNNTVEENQRLQKNLDQLESRLHVLETKAALNEASITEKGSDFIIDKDLNSSVTIVSDNNYSHIDNSPSDVYASDYLQATSVQLPEKASSNNTAQGLTNVNDHQFDEPGMSGEILPVPLDDIQIHEDDALQPKADDDTAEFPFSDAPIIGAPFRLISFVAKYVSGADLVSEK